MMKDVSACQSGLGRLAIAHLDVPSVRHDGTSHDSKDGQRDSLSVPEV